MQKFKIITLGCKVNQAESAALARQLQSRCAQQACDSDPVDLCIINTCTVTAKASMQSRQAVRQAMRASPNAHIVVTGCYAQTAPEEIRRISGVDQVVGNDDKHRVAELVCRRQGDPATAPDHKPTETPVRWMPPANRTERTRAFLKVQDGCSARCSYCIVPAARGASRSLPVEDVLDSIRQISTSGYPEIVLTGIHLGHYGLDLQPACDLLSLLKKIRQQKAAGRVRLSSIEPLELSTDLIAFTADCGNGPASICPHFHVPLQSGDDDILRRMRRPYTRQQFRERIMEIKRRLPAASVGVDVLVGFPGETDAAFDNTAALLRQLPVTYLHVFPFSRRKGTPADRLPDQVPAGVIKERCRIIRSIGNQKKLDFYNQLTSKILEVVAESVTGGDPAVIKGTSANYVPVRFKGGSELLRTIVSVRVERVDPRGQVFGTVVS